MLPRSQGGSTRGIQRSGLKPLLWGEPPAFGGVGGTLPPGFPPEGETGKGAIQIPCCRRLITGAARRGICRPTSTPQILTATQKPEFPEKQEARGKLGSIRDSWAKSLCCGPGFGAAVPRRPTRVTKGKWLI